MLEGLRRDKSALEAEVISLKTEKEGETRIRKKLFDSEVHPT